MIWGILVSYAILGAIITAIGEYFSSEVYYLNV